MKKFALFIIILSLSYIVGCETPGEEILDRTTSSETGRGDGNDDNNDNATGDDDNADTEERRQPEVMFSTAYCIIKEATDNQPTILTFDVICNNLDVDKTASVSLAVDHDNYPPENRAVENVDFTLSITSDLRFHYNYPSTTVTIQTINNDILSGNKYFDIVFTDTVDCATGSPDRLTIAIIDDEQPGNIFSGEYTATARSLLTDNLGNPLTDERWNVRIYSDDTQENTLLIQPVCMFLGLASAAIAPVYAHIDFDNMQLQIPYGQTLVSNTTTGDNYAFVGLDNENNPITMGCATASIREKEGGKYTIEFADNYGVCNLADTGNAMYQAVGNVKWEMK